MARLRRNKPRPPATVHVQITEASHDYISTLRTEKDQPFYGLVEGLLTRMTELDYINKDLKQSLQDSRQIRASLEQRIIELESQLQIGVLVK